jgi:hypothetical protein
VLNRCHVLTVDYIMQLNAHPPRDLCIPPESRQAETFR